MREDEKTGRFVYVAGFIGTNMSFLRHLRKTPRNCGKSCANDELIMIFPEKGKIVSLPPGLSQKAAGEILNPFFGGSKGAKPPWPTRVSQETLRR